MLRVITSLLVVMLLCIGSAVAGPVYAERLRNQPDAWFTTAEGERVLANILSWQNANGGWWKAYDTGVPRPATQPADAADEWQRTSTFDNGATWSELRILARAARVTGEAKYRDAFGRGLGFIFAAQYANGGWPQRFPLEDNYGRHITFNDQAMANVLRLLSDAAGGDGDFGFVSAADRERCRKAFDRGIECILNCQVKIGDRLTIWGQQHDAQALAPAKARSYELPSLCSYESADILLLLMQQPDPSPRMRQAIEAGVAWFEANKITGKRLETVTGPQYENGVDRILVDDPAARPLWARFYDLETGRPFFCSRDGIKRESIAEISHERRMGYAWYNTMGTKVLEAYRKWEGR